MNFKNYLIFILFNIIIHCFFFSSYLFKICKLIRVVDKTLKSTAYLGKGHLEAFNNKVVKFKQGNLLNSGLLIKIKIKILNFYLFFFYFYLFIFLKLQLQKFLL